MDDDKSTRQYFEPPLKVAEIDFTGAALAHGALNRVEEMLRPLAQLMSHVDVHLLRVSIDHLNEARNDHQRTMAERYNAQVRAIVVDKNNEIVFETPFFAAHNFEVRLDYRDDTTIERPADSLELGPRSERTERTDPDSSQGAE